MKSYEKMETLLLGEFGKYERWIERRLVKRSKKVDTYFVIDDNVIPALHEEMAKKWEARMIRLHNSSQVPVRQAPTSDGQLQEPTAPCLSSGGQTMGALEIKKKKRKHNRVTACRPALAEALKSLPEDANNDDADMSDAKRAR